MNFSYVTHGYNPGHPGGAKATCCDLQLSTRINRIGVLTKTYCTETIFQPQMFVDTQSNLL